MSDTDIPRSIRFPKELWDAIDQDARRCKRSSVKQLEALLSTYYTLENVELSKEDLDRTQDHFKYSQKMPILREGAGANDTKKKK